MRSLRPLHRPPLLPRAFLNIVSDGQYPLEATGSVRSDASSLIAYGQSKLALIMATRIMAATARGDDPAYLAAIPGSLLPTDMTHDLLSVLPLPIRALLRLRAGRARSLDRSVAFMCDLAEAVDLKLQSGAILTQQGAARLHPQMHDPAILSALMQRLDAEVRPYLTSITVHNSIFAEAIS
jgi:NAD(P)-dependent dehydrogenase (short-subunit alcohol dehydrogenase family)